MNDHTLFSARFQAVYTLMRIFSVEYIGENGRGVELKRIGARIGLTSCEVEEYLELLSGSGLIATDGKGLLHLEKRFYSTSVWELLVICEPWLDRFPEAGTTPETDHSSRHIRFMQAKKLCEAYMEDLG